MKKFLFALTALLGVSSLQAKEAYIELDNTPSAKPEVVEFFSFYCPHCYNFENIYEIPTKVKASLPEGVEMKQYHVSFLGGQGKLLTKAWALAMLLKVEDKVRTPLFEAVKNANQLRRSDLPSYEDVREIFLKAGVKEEEFNALDSFAVTALVNKQEKLADKLNVQGVPDFYVNQKYRINPEGLPQTEEGFVSGYVQTINELLKK